MPVLSSYRFPDIDDLTHMVGQVSQRTMQGLVDLERVTSNYHGALKIVVFQIRQRLQDHFPATGPLGKEFGPSDGAAVKLLLSVPPWFLAIAGQEVRET